eukprot:3143423-Pyramimonas_sp.AAC.1
MAVSLSPRWDGVRSGARDLGQVLGLPHLPACFGERARGCGIPPTRPAGGSAAEWRRRGPPAGALQHALKVLAVYPALFLGFGGLAALTKVATVAAAAAAENPAATTATGPVEEAAGADPASGRRGRP